MLRNLKPRKAEQIPVQKAEDSMPSAFFFSSGMNRTNGEIPVLAVSLRKRKLWRYGLLHTVSLLSQWHCVYASSYEKATVEQSALACLCKHRLASLDYLHTANGGIPRKDVGIGTNSE